MESTNNFISSATNFYFSPTKKKNFTYRTAKLFFAHPHLQSTNSMTDLRQGMHFKLKTTKSIFPKLKRDPEQVKYNSDNLKNNLMTYRSEFHEKKTELHLLKIKYEKLLIDNINNKALIAQTLGIPTNKAISKHLVFSKIRNCRLDEEKRQILQEAYEILMLKLDVENKKKLLAQKNCYKNDLEKNTKRKIVSTLEIEYFEKCERQRSLLKRLEKLEKKYNICERKINEENEKIKKEIINNERLIDKEVEKVDNIQKIFEEKCNLIKQINQLVDKIKKLEKSNNDKEKQIKEGEKVNIYEEQKLNVINSYKENQSEDENKIKEKAKSKEEMESVINDYEKEIKALKEEYDKLTSKMYKYREEKPKLLKKANEPKKDIEKMETLKKELEELKKTKENNEQLHTQKQNELKGINEQDNKDNEDYIKIIENNNTQRDELNQKIEGLNSKIHDLDDNNNNLLVNINIEKIELNKLSQNLEVIKKQIEQEDLEKKEDLDKIDEEKKKEEAKKIKERKKEIDILKKTHNKLENDNNLFVQQNKKIQDELDGYNITLENYEQIKKELDAAVSKLNSLKK